MNKIALYVLPLKGETPTYHFWKSKSGMMCRRICSHSRERTLIKHAGLKYHNLPGCVVADPAT